MTGADGIAELVSRHWTAEQKERLLRELEAANNKNKAEWALKKACNMRLQKDIDEAVLKVQEICSNNHIR